MSVARRDVDELEIPLFTTGELNFKCRFCGSLTFPAEKSGTDFSNCCHKGKVTIAPSIVPQSLQNLITAGDDLSKNHLDHIRNFNNAFAFVSLEQVSHHPLVTALDVFEFMVKFIIFLLPCIHQMTFLLRTLLCAF